MPKGTRLKTLVWSCRDCGKQDEWTHTGPAPHRCATCRPAHRSRLARKASEKAGPEKVAEWQARHRAKKMGVSEDVRIYLKVRANGRCEICNASDGHDQPLDLDHDHETGTGRGMVCRSCNLALGLMIDSPNLMRRAADYLEMYGGRPRRPLFVDPHH